MPKKRSLSTRKLRMSPEMKRLVGVAITAGVMFGLEKLMESLEKRGIRTDLQPGKMAAAM